MNNPITCRFCDRPARIKQSRLCGAHEMQRRRSGLSVKDFLTAVERGEQPGVVRHICPECGKEIVGGHRKVCSDACEQEQRRRRQREAKQREWNRDPEKARQKQRDRRRKNPEVYRQIDRKKLAKQQADNPRHCQQCGLEITGTHQRKFCSVACRNIVYYSKRRQDASPVDATLAAISLANLQQSERTKSGRTARYIHHCQQCRKEFRSVNAEAKYCSRNCRQQARPKSGEQSYTCLCVVCSQSFLSLRQTAKFCGEICRKKSLAERKRRGKAAIPTTCTVCKKVFAADRQNAATCSPGCRAEAKRIVMRERAKLPEVQERAKLLARKRHNVKINCTVCGKDMGDLPDLRTNRYTCSEECRNEARKQRSRRTYLRRRNRQQ